MLYVRLLKTKIKYLMKQENVISSNISMREYYICK